jgi:hypothetical protein
VVESTFVASYFATTVAFGIAAPLASKIVPVTSPLTDWPKPGKQPATVSKSAPTSRMLFIVMCSLPPLRIATGDLTATEGGLTVDIAEQKQVAYQVKHGLIFIDK